MSPSFSSQGKAWRLGDTALPGAMEIAAGEECHSIERGVSDNQCLISTHFINSDLPSAWKRCRNGEKQWGERWNECLGLSRLAFVFSHLFSKGVKCIQLSHKFIFGQKLCSFMCFNFCMLNLLYVLPSNYVNYFFFLWTSVSVNWKLLLHSPDFKLLKL